MRTIAVIIASLLLAVAATPLASAAPGGPDVRPCAPQTWTGGAADVSLKENCGLHVEVLPNLICLMGVTHVEKSVDRHSVAVNVCRATVGAPPVAAAGCPAVKGVNVGGVAQVYGEGANGEGSCVNVDIDFMDCLWNGSWKTVAETGALRVRVYSCDGASPA